MFERCVRRYLRRTVFAAVLLCGGCLAPSRSTPQGAASAWLDAFRTGDVRTMRAVSSGPVRAGCDAALCLASDGRTPVRDAAAIRRRCLSGLLARSLPGRNPDALLPDRVCRYLEAYFSGLSVTRAEYREGRSAVYVRYGIGREYPLFELVERDGEWFVENVLVGGR